MQTGIVEGNGLRPSVLILTAETPIDQQRLNLLRKMLKPEVLDPVVQKLDPTGVKDNVLPICIDQLLARDRNIG